MQKREGRSFPSSYFRHASAVIFEYDETDEQSFTDIMGLWLPETSRFLHEDALFFLIGNKNDLVENGTPRFVTDEQVQELADRFKTKPMHISALTGAGCEDAFNYISQLVIKQFVSSSLFLFSTLC